MKKTIFKERFLVFFFVCLGVFLVTLLGCLFFLLRIENRELLDWQQQDQAYLVAGELRQSSTDLTKMAYLYVLTGNPEYIKYYNQILSIRNGFSPKPEKYNRVYWDLVIANAHGEVSYGPPISLKMQIGQLDLLESEIALLTKAQAASDKLAKLEEEAMEAMQGRFKNASGFYATQGTPDPKLARELLTSKEYLNLKVKVMQPLQEFHWEVADRYQRESDELSQVNQVILIASIVLLVGLGIAMVLFLHKALRSLAKVQEENNHLLLCSLPPAISEQLEQEKESDVKECEAGVLFLSITCDVSDRKFAEAVRSIYGELDQLVEEIGVERIKALHGSYMVVSGISDEKGHHVDLLATFALAAQDKVAHWSEILKMDLSLRIGMAHGTVIVGVLEKKKYIYDLWGNVLKVAQRLEAHAKKGTIQVTKQMMSQITGSSFDLVRKEEEPDVYLLQKKI